MQKTSSGDAVLLSVCPLTTIPKICQFSMETIDFQWKPLIQNWQIFGWDHSPSTPTPTVVFGKNHAACATSVIFISKWIISL